MSGTTLRSPHRRTIGRVLRPLVLLVAPGVAVATLHQVGGPSWPEVDWRDPLAWLAATGPQDALAAVLRLASLGLGYWLCAVTALHGAARVIASSPLERLARVLTPSALRRTLDRALVTTAAAGLAVHGAAPLPATADPAETAPVTAPAPPGLAPPSERVTPDEVPATAPAEAPREVGIERSEIGGREVRPADAEPMSPDATSRSETSEAGSSIHEVTAGDHLWSIARDHLASTRAVDPASLTVRDVARYWARVVDENRGAVRSGDPDIIYPGERIVLPPTGD